MEDKSTVSNNEGASANGSLHLIGSRKKNLNLIIIKKPNPRRPTPSSGQPGRAGEGTWWVHVHGAGVVTRCPAAPTSQTTPSLEEKHELGIYISSCTTGLGDPVPRCKSVLCSQGCFIPGLGPLPLAGHGRIRAPISEQGGEFWAAKCRNITGTPRPGVLTGLGKGRAVAGAWGEPSFPLGAPGRGSSWSPTGGTKGCVTWRRSNAARGVRRETQLSFECKPK